jgi:hypothetical protein
MFKKSILIILKFNEHKWLELRKKASNYIKQKKICYPFTRNYAVWINRVIFEKNERKMGSAIRTEEKKVVRQFYNEMKNALESILVFYVCYNEMSTMKQRNIEVEKVLLLLLLQVYSLFCWYRFN